MPLHQFEFEADDLLPLLIFPDGLNYEFDFPAGPKRKRIASREKRKNAHLIFRYFDIAVGIRSFNTDGRSDMNHSAGIDDSPVVQTNIFQLSFLKTVRTQLALWEKSRSAPHAAVGVQFWFLAFDQGVAEQPLSNQIPRLFHFKILPSHR